MDYASCMEQLKEGGYRVLFRHWRYPTVYSIESGMLNLCRIEAVSLVAKQSPATRMRRYYRHTKCPFPQFTPYAKGGKTEVEIQELDTISQEWETVIVGESHCMRIDSFCYREGRALALQDAMFRLNKKG